MTPPTDRQREVLAAIRDHWRNHGNGPTTRDLMAALGFASTNAVVGHLRTLARKGLVVWERGGARGIWPAGLKAKIAAAVAELEGENGNA